MKEKEDLLNAEMKSYSDNILIKGMKFVTKEAQKDDESQERFREAALRVLVDQGLIPAKKVFVIKGDNKGHILRGVLRHAHPLGNRDNRTVVVAFLAADCSRKIVMKSTLKAPWICLEKLIDGKSTAIDFDVDDHRLVNPALTLAKMEQEDKDNFVLKAFLPLAEKAFVRASTVKARADVESKLDESAMELF